jgi:membrane associated rhomboid family serine protease
MVSASVGFQCPECVREGTASTRQARTIAGGRVVSNVGLITRVIIGIDVVVFLLEFVSGVNYTAAKYGMLGYGFYDGALHGVAEGEWYRLLTAAFLHGGLLHLLFNMYALFLVGTAVEAALGRARYAALFILSALGGSAASYVFSDPRVPSVGASGAIFGLFGAFLVISHRLRHDVQQIIGLIVINLIIGFLPSLHIDWRAHVGGLVAGTVLAAVFVHAPPRLRLPAAWVSCLVVLFVVVAMVAARTSYLHAHVPGL